MTATISTALQSVAAQAQRPAARREHPFYEGEFLPAETSQVSESTIPDHSSKEAFSRETSVTKGLEKHPFYEGEYLDPNEGSRLFGSDGFNFLDLIDVVNPLQHIPIISSIYRHVTGDELSPISRMAGGFLFGGPAGFAVSVVNAVIEDATGKDLGETVIAMISGDMTDTVTQVASISKADRQSTSDDDVAKATNENKVVHPGLERKSADNTAASQDLVLDGPTAVEGPTSLLPKIHTPQTTETKRTVPDDIETFRFGGMTVMNHSLEPKDRFHSVTSPMNSSALSLFGSKPNHKTKETLGVALKESPVETSIRKGSVPFQKAADNITAHRLQNSSASIIDQSADLQTPDEALEESDIAYAPGQRRTLISRSAAARKIPARRKPPTHVVPSNFIPKSMMDALTKYEALLKQQRSASRGLTL